MTSDLPFRPQTDLAALRLHSRAMHNDGDRAAFDAVAGDGLAGNANPDTCPPASSPGNSVVVVFVGPMEHHSNLLVWRELPDCKVTLIHRLA